MTASPGRRRLDPDDRRRELLAAAERLFTARPFDAVSLDDLADEAGVSKNLLYHYFASKRELYSSMLRTAAEDLLAATDPDPGLPPVERLRASLDAHLAYAEEHAAGYVALLRGAAADPEAEEVVRTTRDAVVRRTAAQLPLEGDPSPRVLTALHGWVGFVDEATLHWLERRDLERAAMVALLADVFVAVLTAAARE